MIALRIAVLAICLFLVATAASGQDGIVQKSERSEFDLASYSSFVRNNLSMSEASSSLRPFGFATRKVHGQVLDCRGEPIAGALVALVEHIGFSDQCFEENFDLTDDQGRFIVEGQFDKVCVVVRQSKWAIHRETLVSDQKVIQIKFPELATCRIKVDKNLLGDAVSVYVQTQGYWAGINSMGGAVGIDQSGTAVIHGLIPTKYCVSVNRTVPIGTKTESGHIEIGSFELSEGDDQFVELKRGGKRILQGKLPFDTEETPMVLKVFRQFGENQTPSRMVDVVSVKQDGAFVTDPVPPGNYLLKAVGPNRETDNNIRGFGSGIGLRRETHNRRLTVPELDQPLDVDWNRDERSPIRAEVERQLEQAMYNTEFQIRALLNHKDRQAVANELVSILADGNAPQEWYERVGYTLVGMLDEAGAVEAILQEVEKSAETGRGAIWWLMRADKAYPEIIECLGKHRHCSQINMRHAVHLVLLQLVQKDSTTQEVILPWLIEALDDPNPSSRYQIARVMGWTQSVQAVAKLKQLTKDPDAQVRVVAAVAIAEITQKKEDRESAVKLLTKRLFAKSLHGQVTAAQGLRRFGELPPIAIKALLQKARIEPSKDYRDPVRLTTNSLREAAIQTLKKVDPDALKNVGE